VQTAEEERNKEAKESEKVNLFKKAKTDGEDVEQEGEEKEKEKEAKLKAATKDRYSNGKE